MLEFKCPRGGFSVPIDVTWFPVGGDVKKGDHFLVGGGAAIKNDLSLMAYWVLS